MPRFLSWLVIGLSAAFLVVATASFSQQAVAALAFAIGIGALTVSAAVAYSYRGHAPTRLTASATAALSIWTIVSSLVFSAPTVQSLTLASALALGGLALVGLTAHEVSNESAIAHSLDATGEGESRLAAAA